MIIKIVKPGKSFKGVLAYLTHDVGQTTSDGRVPWKQTLNLAHDDPAAAAKEMHATWRDADLLKTEAGKRAGSRVEKPVKHLSLSWDPSEKPEREEMVRAATSFLRHMGWDEHQAVLVAHTDKPYAHVHIVVNAIHPTTGMKLDDGFEKSRAQKWAHGYEQERGKIFCEERLKPAAERTPSEPRPAWMDMRTDVGREVLREMEQAPFDFSYLQRGLQRPGVVRNEWDILKEQQRHDRLQFFAGGAEIYKKMNAAIYQNVKKEYRASWAAYYAAQRSGCSKADGAEWRASIAARQKEAVRERCEIAVEPIRAERDRIYRAMLETQKSERALLAARQEQGLSSPRLLDKTYADRSAAERERKMALHHANSDRVDILCGLDAHGVGSLDRFGIRRGRDARREGGVYRHVIQDGHGPRENDGIDRFGIRRGRGAEREENIDRVAGLPDRGEPRPPLPSRQRVGVTTRSHISTPSSRDVGSALAGGLLSIIGGLGESMLGGHTAKPKQVVAPRDALERFGVRRGVLTEPGDDPAQKDKATRDAWYAWKEKRDLERSRDGW